MKKNLTIAVLIALLLLMTAFSFTYRSIYLYPRQSIIVVCYGTDLSADYYTGNPLQMKVNCTSSNGDYSTSPEK